MADPQWPPSHGKRHLLTEGAVRTMSVVVINELAEDRFELRAMEHKHRVEHSRRAVPTNNSPNAFAPGDRMGVRMIRAPSARNTSSKLAVNLVSRSRIKNFVGRARSARTKLRLRACWVTHSPAGLVVMPVAYPLRVSSSMKKST